MPAATLARTRLEVFAIEDTAAQVCWGALPAGAELRAGDASFTVERDGPGAAVLEPLEPGRRYDLLLDGRPVAHFRTLVPPPGELLCRFSTVNDLHVGERRFGLLRTMTEGAPRGSVDTYALRCARAACHEAVAWGGQALVVKGDLTWSGRLLQWDAVGALLTSLGVPTMVVLGNHDVGATSVDAGLALSRHGIDLAEEPAATDLPGIRIVLAQTAVHDKGWGRVDGHQLDAIVELLRTAGGPAFLAMHHYPQRFRHALMYPPGIPAPQSVRLLDAVAAANPSTLITAGHSHRNRRHRHGPLVIAEIGATMHYPGTWAGYAVHEGGVRQVVRRVAAADAIAWTERSRRAIGGLWGRWAEGERAHRCFTHVWP